jgi:hypothetical protein
VLPGSVPIRSSRRARISSSRTSAGFRPRVAHSGTGHRQVTRSDGKGFASSGWRGIATAVRCQGDRSHLEASVLHAESSRRFQAASRRPLRSGRRDASLRDDVLYR